MGKLKIERLAQELQKATICGSYVDYVQALKTFANCAHKMALRGRLYCTTENGEMRKVEIKE